MRGGLECYGIQFAIGCNRGIRSGLLLIYLPPTHLIPENQPREKWTL